MSIEIVLLFLQFYLNEFDKDQVFVFRFKLLDHQCCWLIHQCCWLVHLLRLAGSMFLVCFDDI